MYVRMYVCMYVYMYVCMYACMHVCMYVVGRMLVGISAYSNPFIDGCMFVPDKAKTKGA